MSQKLKANVVAHAAVKPNDINAPVSEKRPRKFSIGSLDLVTGGTTIDGWAWNEHAPSRPVQVMLHIDGQVVALITPQNFRADLAAAGIAHGCFAFSWNIPSKFRDGLPHEVRAYVTDFKEEIPQSPLIFTLAADSDKVGPNSPALFVNPQFDLWASGLSGTYTAKSTEIAPGLVVSFEEGEGEGEFFVTGPQFPSSAITPYYGIRLVNNSLSPSWLYHKFSELAKQPLSKGTLLSQEFSLVNSTDATYQRVANIWLVQKVKDDYQRLRRISRGRVFRRPTLLTFFLKLTPEEQGVLATRTLFLGVSVEKATTYQIYAPQIVKSYVDPLPGLMGFEDQRLTAAFEACRELAAVNGHTEEYDRLLNPTIPTASVTPVADKTVPDDKEYPPNGRVLAHIRYPFTQIIVPAHNGDVIVADCLRSLQKNTYSPFQCLVINDGSLRHTSEMLNEFILTDPRFVMYDREVNRGYTKSINEAIKLSGAEWIVILNSDTVVSQGWLPRLHDASAAHADVGMVGPLSNAASYQSLPSLRNSDGTWSKNDFIKPSDIDRVQTLLESFSERGYPTVPLLNGFCTLISRQVFDRCGLFDEDAFPIGYGEETDLCLRASKAGFRLVIADDCFVYHRKSVTFGAKGRKKLSQAGNNEILNKHIGLIMPELEQVMQNNAVLARIRERMTDLKLSIG